MERLTRTLGKKEGNQQSNIKKTITAHIGAMKQNNSSSIAGTSTKVLRRPKSNPFLAPPVIRSFMKKVELPTQVKMLRKICSVWNGVCIEELKKRAFQGEIKTIDLCSSWKLEERLATFLKDTQNNPKLFRSFHFNLPRFLLNDKFRPILSKYPISFLLLEHNNYGYGHQQDPIPAEDIKLLNYLDGIAPHLFGLELCQDKEFYSSDGLENSFIVSSGREAKGRFPNLRKLILESFKGVELFKKIWGLKEFSNPAPNLTSLLLEIEDRDLKDLFGPARNLCQLTHLDIGGFTIYKNLLTMLERTSWILSLAHAGMRLKYFSMQLASFYGDDAELEMEDEDLANVIIFPETYAQICSNLTAFFKTQANSLEDLRLLFSMKQHYEIESEEVDANSLKVSLPVFISIRRLEIFNSSEIQFNGEIISKPITFHSYSRNFPALEDLTILGRWEDMYDWGTEHKEAPLTLKRLKVSDGRNDILGSIKTIEDDRAYLFKDVRSVETLEVGWTPGMDDFFFRYGEELPWIESLKVLHIYRICKPLKLGHLKNLKTIVIENDEFSAREMNRNMGNPACGCNPVNPQDNTQYYKGFLDMFIHISKMDLDLIKFRGFEMSPKIRAEFVKYFPFKVKFVKEPIPDWNLFSNTFN